MTADLPPEVEATIKRVEGELTDRLPGGLRAEFDRTTVVSDEFTRPGWDEFFLGIARATSTRGNCLRAQVGCVIVDASHRIVTGGYNGPPSGQGSCVDGPEFCPCGTDPGSERAGTATVSRSLCPALHAEQNAVAYGGRDCRGGTAYLTKAPCHSCRKLLAAAGVVRVVVEGEGWWNING